MNKVNALREVQQKLSSIPPLVCNIFNYSFADIIELGKKYYLALISLNVG